MRARLSRFGAALCALVLVSGPALANCPDWTGLDAKSGLADPARHTNLARGMWSIWYDPEHFDQSDARTTLNRLNAARCLATVQFGLEVPKSVRAGEMVNVYLHDPYANDGFDDELGNGVGSDDREYPFMTLPLGAHEDASNVYHEAFHIFQFETTSTGFRYEGDSGWFVETTANWFAMEAGASPDVDFLTVSSIAAAPHLPLWHGFDHESPAIPDHWITGNRQYGQHLFLEYLVSRTSLNKGDILGSFYDGIAQSPQAHLAGLIGHDRFAEVFSDYAALLTAGFLIGEGPMPDWVLSPAQRDRSLEELRWAVSDEPPGRHYRPITFALERPDWHMPARDLRPSPYGWNVIALPARTKMAVIELESPVAGDLSLRLVEFNNGEWTVSPLGNGAPIAPGAANTAFIIVSHVPDRFTGHGGANYRVRLLD